MKSIVEPSSRPVMPDDNEPITQEWLAEVCYSNHAEDLYGFENESIMFEIEVLESGKFEFSMAGFEIPFDRIKTRGDVRDVCWLIGCPWFDECWGNS